MNKKQQLLKAAETRVRAGGYSNFSFRELASEVGIKSASVHYHFPTKADLGAELARQYTFGFLDALGDVSDLVKQGVDPIEKYIGLFRTALVKDKQMCLCGLLGAESEGLPDKVRVEAQGFFQKNLAWLQQAYKTSDKCSASTAKVKAAHILSLLEGAIMVSKTLDDNAIFELALSEIAKD